MDNKRAEYVKGLVAFSWLQQHEDVPVPTYCYFHYYASNEDKPAELLAKLGEFDKQYIGSEFTARKNFGPIPYDICFDREKVCERRVVGIKHHEAMLIPARDEEIVEWDCKPVMKKEE